MCARIALKVSAATTTSTTTTTTSKQQTRFCLNIFVLLTAFACVVGRKALPPPADVEDELKQVEIDNVEIESFLPARDGPSCSIEIQRDLPKPNQSQPLYLRPGSSKYWLPNNEGYLEVPHGRTIELACTSPFANATGVNGAQGLGLQKRTRTIRPRCWQGTTFLLKNAKHEFRDFMCTQKVKYTAERLSQRCANNTAQLYRIGYNLTSNRFVETMRACYDDAEVRTLFVRHPLAPANLHFQKGVKRSQFSKLGHFAIDMNAFYTRKNQHTQATRLLGSEEAAMKYFGTKSRTLSRGHLAAKSDMIYATQQRATFNFFNVVPQWQSFNGGAWATLEEKVRSFVAKAQREVICYTGTYGKMRFSNASLPFHLAVDANNNDVLPVPKLMYRVIVASDGREGIVLVGVNNPFSTMTEILEDYVICEDVRAQVPWLSWIRNSEKSLKFGYLYACRVAEFVTMVTDLPRELAVITELLK